jgi:ferredoxin-nitrite reductase
MPPLGSFYVRAIGRILDEADRKDRQKARLMWLIESYGVDNFKQKIISEVNSYGRGVLIDDAQPTPTDTFIRRELLGVHKQSERDASSKFRVGIHVPTGRLSFLEARQIADLAERYSGGEIRLTVEQNVLLPNVSESQLDDLLKEPALRKESRLSVFPGLIEGNVVSCTGSQFCGLALIETKSNAANIARKLEQLVQVDRPVRIHWTGWYVIPSALKQVQPGIS